MEQRIEFGLKAMRTLNFRALFEQYGISAKTGYKWRKERFIPEGLEGMEEESRRPRQQPGAAAGGASVRDRTLKTGASELGTTQD